MMSLTLPAPAKLNLFLHITGRRADGYHNLESVFQFIDWCDLLNFAPNTGPDLVQLSGFTDPALNGPANLIVKAAHALAAHPAAAERTAPVSITVNKQLPMGGGLGGGSSNAATTLLALRQLWQLPISDSELAQIGLSLGADVPIFLFGRAAFARGVGEQLQAVAPEPLWYLVVHPQVEISTAAIFQHPELPRATAAIDPAQWQLETTHNDCQQLVCQAYPEVAKALRWLLEYAPARLTGTGACVFAWFTSQTDAQHVLRHLPQPWRGVVVKGLNQSPVHAALQRATTANL